MKIYSFLKTTVVSASDITSTGIVVIFYRVWRSSLTRFH